MILHSATSPLHLCYCLNVHRGESWAENLAAIRENTLAVKQRIAPDRKFGLGLRLSHQAACDLASPSVRESALAFFKTHGLYASTINGFPYGRFHGTRVKEQVYAPDWRTAARRDYTIQLADLLAGFLPEGMEGSISTVPCSFKPWMTGTGDVEQVVEMLVDCIVHLAWIEEQQGSLIHLGLEPEPSCYLETTAETIHFFKESLLTQGANRLARKCGLNRAASERLIRRHLGVCFDTCHVAIQFEDPEESYQQYLADGIRISKVQISAALETGSSPKSQAALAPFCEPVYLHQVKARKSDGSCESWPDLPEALHDLGENPERKELRVHFHVPLFFDSLGELRSTAHTLTPGFFELLRRNPPSQLEIETYTFDVLPGELRSGGITDSITREYQWVLEKI